MKNELMNFNFTGSDIRVVTKNGEPWFVAKDVANVLGISNVADNIKNYPDKEKDIDSVYTLGGKQKMATISEAGLYRMIFQSRKPEAERFKDWVFNEVLPSIRKTGHYAVMNEEPKEIFIARALIAAGQMLEEKNAKIKELEPKAEFADLVSENSKQYSFQKAAKVLGFEGVGEKNLFEFARNYGLLMKDNQPYQQYVNSGLFKIVVQNFEKPSGEKSVNLKTVITGKGLDYLSKMLKARGHKQVHQFLPGWK